MLAAIYKTPMLAWWTIEGFSPWKPHCDTKFLSLHVERSHLQPRAFGTHGFCCLCQIFCLEILVWTTCTTDKIWESENGGPKELPIRMEKNQSPQSFHPPPSGQIIKVHQPRFPWITNAFLAWSCQFFKNQIWNFWKDLQTLVFIQMFSSKSLHFKDNCYKSLKGNRGPGTCRHMTRVGQRRSWLGLSMAT